MTTFLVIGATGTVGGEVTRALLERGQAVRAGVRNPDRAGELEQLGARPVRLDLDDPSSVEAAFDGVDRLFVVLPFDNRLERYAVTVVDAAKKAGVGFILKLSAAGVSEEAPFELGRQHARADRRLLESGLSAAILRPTFFQDNLLKFQLGALERDGAFYGASHGGRVAYVSSRDIAAVAAAILLDPERHAGTEPVLTGPEALSDEEVAALASAVRGKPVRYVDVSDEQLAESLRSQGAPDWMVEALVGLERVKAAGWASSTSPAIEALTGRAPEPYSAFLERNAPRLPQ